MEDNKKKKKNYITFSKKQIVSIQNHHNSDVIDHKTGKVMLMYTIRLPSKNYRKTRFGEDSQGIDRDSRSASISIGAPYISQSDSNPNIFYTYPDPLREFTVQFKGHVLGRENNKSIFDKPESIKIKGDELIDIFSQAKEISKKKQVELKKKKQEVEKPKLEKADKKGEQVK